MHTLFTFFLALHIAAGTSSLVTGTINIAGRKGGKLHRRAGRVFFYSMLVVALSAFILSYLHPNLFLFIIGVFTAYLVLTGNAYLQFKAQDIQKAGAGHYVLTIAMLLFAAGFVYYGIQLVILHQSFGYVLIVFGSIAALMCLQDFRNYSIPACLKLRWLTTHLQRMTGSYIAALTAFLVVNNTFLPAVVAWLLPTMVLTPLIIFWSIRYTPKTKHIVTNNHKQ